MRFPGFDGEWETKKLGEIAMFSKGKGISKIDIEDDGKIECIRYGELYTHYSEIINEIKSLTNINEADLIFSEVNDVIIPASGESAVDIATASCVLKDKVALGGDLNIIKTNNNGVFLAYYLNNKKKLKIASLAQGVSVVHLYSSQLATLSLNLPKLNEQKKISSFLALLDERIQTQNKIIEELSVLKTNIAKKIFSQKIRFKNNDRSKFPEWMNKKFREIATITMGQSPESTSYNVEGIGFPLIQGNADILNRLSAPRQYTKNPTKKCDIGDVLLTVRAPVGYVSKSLHNACIGRGICSIKSNKHSSNEFIYQFLLYYENKWKSLEQGSTFTSINSSDIGSITIKIPCIEEQLKISKLLFSIDLKINTEIQLLQRLEEQKHYLLQQMFI